MPQLDDETTSVSELQQKRTAAKRKLTEEVGRGPRLAPVRSTALLLLSAFSQEMDCNFTFVCACFQEGKLSKVQAQIDAVFEDVYPQLKAAETALARLTKSTLAEIKSFKHPPPLVYLVLQAVSDCVCWSPPSVRCVSTRNAYVDCALRCAACWDMALPGQRRRL